MSTIILLNLIGVLHDEHQRRGLKEVLGEGVGCYGKINQHEEVGGARRDWVCPVQPAIVLGPAGTGKNARATHLEGPVLDVM